MSKTYWPVQIKGGVTVCVQQDLNQMSTYILLEQEDWCKDEMGFIRSYITPGMNAFDIGANHGVYALTMAKNIGQGHIWAFEPTSAPGLMLERSIRLNGYQDTITLVRAGLSNKTGEAKISVSGNSELNSLHSGSGRRETIQLYALDLFMEKGGITSSIDFVKLDAEGEEVPILLGGRKFFIEQSPLVMFELKHGTVVNEQLVSTFRMMGYGIYRLLPDMDILVDYTPEMADNYVLNLFACKPDRADKLAERGLICSVEQYVDEPTDIDELEWTKRIFDYEFAKSSKVSWLAAAETMDPNHHKALSAALVAFDRSVPARRRVALLNHAIHLLGEIPAPASHHISVWLTRINLLHHLGYRMQSFELANALHEQIPPTVGVVALPFLPPCDRFYSWDMSGSFMKSLLIQLSEFTEYRKAYSSFFTQGEVSVDLCDRVWQWGLEPERRTLLKLARKGTDLRISHMHPLLDAASSPNSEIWKSIVRSDKAA